MLYALLLLLLVACAGPEGTATPRPTPEAVNTPAPASTPAPTAGPTPVPTAQLTPGPSPAVAALRWELLQPAGEAPGPRKDSTLVYDDANQLLWLFGGRVQGKETNELWAFDLGRERWSQVVAPNGPAGRWGHTAIFDSQRRQMVLFSGQSSAGFFNDTWLFDTMNRNWKEVAQAGGLPSPRYGSCAGYDPERDVMYISHGFTNSGRFDDTWAFGLASNRWTEVSPDSNRPIKRCLHRCGFDPQSQSFYLFGGQSNEVPILGDLWRFDPSRRTWSEVPLAETRPSPRFFSALLVDEAARRLLLFGGLTGQGPVNDLWSFAPASGWTRLNPVEPLPAPRSNHAAASDPWTRRVYAFGGLASSELGDLWRLRLD